MQTLAFSRVACHCAPFANNDKKKKTNGKPNAHGCDEHTKCNQHQSRDRQRNAKQSNVQIKKGKQIINRRNLKCSFVGVLTILLLAVNECLGCVSHLGSSHSQDFRLFFFFSTNVFDCQVTLYSVVAALTLLDVWPPSVSTTIRAIGIFSFRI